jgi:hypothetical protein
MAADGLSALDALNWNTTTGGAAGLAETTSTLGQDRLDLRTPPDAYRLWHRQINQCKNLLLSMSAFFKGGTRLQVLPQSSNPFGSVETGFYVDNSGNPKLSYNGAVSGLGAGATGNWLFSGNAADLSGAGAMGLGTSTATSLRFFPPTLNFTTAASFSAAAQGATNTTGLTIAPNVADGASSIGLVLNNGTALTSGILQSWQTNANEYMRVTNASATAANYTVLKNAVTNGGIKLLSPSGTAVLSVDEATTGAQIAYGNNKMTIAGGGLTMTVNSSNLVYTTGNVLQPTDIGVALGDTTHRFLGLYNGGPLSGKLNSQSGATYTAVAGDYSVIMTNSAARTVTLPAANAFIAGQVICVKDGNGNAATNNVTVSRAGADTIDGGSATSVVINTNNGKLWLQSDGSSKWWQIV